MTRTMQLATTTLAMFLMTAAAHAVVVIDFEDLSLSPESYNNGSDNAGGFNSGGAEFNNSFTDFGAYTVWSGFAYSNTTDATSPGFGNQYSAYPGSGAGSSANYGIAFNSTQGDSVITLPTPTTVDSLDVTNTTYAGLSMRDGDSFSKKFGGTTGDDEDYFLLTIYGKDSGGGATGSVDVYLADFRDADNANDYVLDSWLTVDLSPLGNQVKSLEFDFASTDVGQYGINTPLFFALDNLAVAQVPEPAAFALLLLASLGLTTRRYA